MQLIEQLQQFNPSLGLPEKIWQAIELELSSTVRSEELIEKLKFYCNEIARLALEAGHYQLALEIGLNSKYDSLRAQLLLSRKSEVVGQLDQVDSPLKEALEMQIEKMSGQARFAIEIFEIQIEKKMSLASQEDQAEIHLQAGSAYFNSAKYEVALQHYTLAYELFETLNRQGKMAIAAFNASVAARHADQKQQERTWLWYSINILKTYHLENLQTSVRLFEVEQLVADRKFESALGLGQKLQKQDNLNLIQKTLLSQSLAIAQVEMGHVTEAEVLAAQSRQLMLSHQFFQYEIFQIALEQNIEVLTHRKIVRPKSYNQPQRASDLRALVTYKVSLARKALLDSDQVKFQRLVEEIASTSPRNSLNHLAEDLDMVFTHTSMRETLTARAQNDQLFRALQARNYTQVQMLFNFFQVLSSRNVWQNSLMNLAQASIEYRQNNILSAQASAEACLKLAERAGLERVASIAFGLIATIDSQRQPQWINHLNSFETAERSWIENFFINAFGVNLFSGRWMFSSHEKKILSDETSVDSDLVIDQKHGRVKLFGELLPITGQSILFKLLVAIAYSQNQGLNKEEIAQQVWDYSYDPSIHDSLIYTNVRRLRELVPIELFDGKYRLSQSVRWVFLTEEREATGKLDLTSRQREILALLTEQNGTLHRRQLVEKLGISERTALRELTELVDMRVLIREGSGRSVAYRSSRKGVVA